MMQIKRCLTSDIPTLITVSTQSYREHYTYLWEDNGENYIRSNFSYEQFEKELADENSHFFLITESGHATGILKFNANKHFENYNPQSVLEIERLYFIKEATGRGLGNAVINFVIGLAKERGKQLLFLKTMDNSAALEFYKKQGFSISAITSLNYPFIKEEYNKMLILSRTI